MSCLSLWSEAANVQPIGNEKTKPWTILTRLACWGTSAPSTTWPGTLWRPPPSQTTRSPGTSSGGNLTNKPTVCMTFSQGIHEPDHVPALQHEVQGPCEGWGGEDQGRLWGTAWKHASGFQKPGGLDFPKLSFLLYLFFYYVEAGAIFIKRYYWISSKRPQS